MRPEAPAATDHVFLGKGGRPIREVRGGFDPAVLAAWKPSRPDERKPRFHDLRKTGATCVEAVSSHSVAKAFLGHSDQDGTDSYIHASLDDVRNAVNRAARSIDGETPGGGDPFPDSIRSTRRSNPLKASELTRGASESSCVSP